MANERNVITVIVQAIDRTKGIIEQTKKDLRELDRQQREMLPSTSALDAEFESLSKSVADYDKGLKDANRSSSALDEQIRDLRIELDLQNNEYERLTELSDKSNQSQLTFFDRLSKGNKVLGERRRLLKDMNDEEIRAQDLDFRRRDQIIGLTERGRIISPRRGQLGALGEQEQFEQATLFGQEAEIAERRVSRLSQALFGLSRPIRSLIPQFQRLRKAQADAFDPADLTRFDETFQIAFRRIARLLAMFAVFLPFLTTALGTILGGITALVGGVTALAAAFGTLVGVVAALPGLFAATIGAAGALMLVLGPGLSTVVERFKEITQLEENTRKQSTENLRATRDAEEALADARLQNAQQIADIEDRISEERRNNAEEVADQERDLARLRVRNSEQERDLVREIRRAKRDAAEEARQNERDYRELVQENRVDERDLAAELSARRASLGALIQQGADQSEIDAARAGVRRAEAQSREEIRENRAQEERALRANRTQRQNDVERIADLERRLARTRRDNTQEEADAERRLARTRRDNAEELVDLERQRQRLIQQGARQERDALQRLTEARRKSSVDTADSLKDLTEAERTLVLQLKNVRDMWESLTTGARERGLTFIAQALGQLQGRLPEIARGLSNITDALVGVGRDAVELFTSPERWGRFSRILEDTEDNAVAIAEAFVSVADAFLTLADAARPLVQRISQGIRGAAEDFNEVVQRQEESGGLEQFFDATNRVLTLTVNSLKNLGSALLDIAVIAEPFGEILLGDFLEWTEGIKEFTSSPQGAAAIKSFFEDSVPIVEALANFVDELVQALFGIGRELIRPDELEGVSLLQEIIEGLTNALPDFRDFIVESFRVNGPVVIDFLDSFAHLMGVLVGPGGAIVQFIDLITFVIDLIDRLPDGFERLIFTYLIFNKTLLAIGASLRRFGGALTASILPTKRLQAAIAISAFLAFPGLLDAITEALNGMRRAIEFVLTPLDRLLEALGLGEGTASTAVTFAAAGGLLYLLGARGLLGAIGTLGKAIVGAMRDIRLFYQLLRAGQAGSFFLNFLNAAVDLFRVWVERIRQARTAQRQLNQERFISNFSALGDVIATAVRALADYITNLRRARTAQRALNAERAVGIATGLGGLPIDIFGRGGAGRVPRPPTAGPTTLTRIGALLPMLARAAGLMGLIVTAAVGLDKALERLGAPQWLQNLMVPLLNLHDILPKVRDDALGFFGGLARFSQRLNIPDPFGFRKMVIDSGRAQRTVRGTHREVTVFDRIARGMKGTLEGLNRALRTVPAGAWANAMRGALEDVGRSLESFVVSARTAGLVPAQAELDRLDRQETLRDRSTRRRDADNELAQAQRQVQRSVTSLAGAERRLAAARRRLRQAAFGTPSPAESARLAAQFGFGGIPVGQRFQANPEQVRRAQQAVRDAQAAVRQRKQELNDARRHEREMSEARRETYRQVALEERRERLTLLAAQQERERQLSAEAAGRRANAEFQAWLDAYDKALKDGNLPKANRIRRKLIDLLTSYGVSKEQAVGWLAGKKVGEDFQSGLIEALNAVGVLFRVRGAVVFIPPDKDSPRGGGGKRPGKAAGGRIDGGEGMPIQVLAHGGEWIVNRSQQWKLASITGIDRTALERALFHRIDVKPQFAFARGGVVSNGGNGIGGTQFLTPINIQTASPTVDIEYVTRAFESRIAAAV